MVSLLNCAMAIKDKLFRFKKLGRGITLFRLKSISRYGCRKSLESQLSKNRKKLDHKVFTFDTTLELTVLIAILDRLLNKVPTQTFSKWKEDDNCLGEKTWTIKFTDIPKKQICVPGPLDKKLNLVVAKFSIVLSEL